MLRVCIDTNIWISGLVFGGAPAEVVNFAFKKRFQLVISTEILDELEKNLISKFDFTQRAARKLTYTIAEDADLYTPQGTVHVIAEKHADNMVLETAVLGKARYLVTGDRKHLLPLHVFRNVKIIEPAAFLSIVKK